MIDISIGDAVTIQGGGARSARSRVLAEVDHFEILKPLGAGGFGTVYLARDTTSDIEVALKVIGKDRKSAFDSFGWTTTVKPGDPTSIEDELRKNFKLIHGLTHPHIAVAYPLHVVRGVKKFGEVVFVTPKDILSVMAYAPGVTLDEWRKKSGGGNISERLVADIVTQIASALDYAHESGVIHRDVKPSNVMVETREGGKPFVRLLDFGLAAAVGGGRGVCGTPKYMSPEQWEGCVQDERTDQYSLAVLACELLTGHAPLEDVFELGSREAIRNAVLHRKLELPHRLSFWRRKVIAKAMAKSPDGRYATCGAFAAALALRPPLMVCKLILFAVFALSVGLVLLVCTREEVKSAPVIVPEPPPLPPPSPHEHVFGEWRTDCEARCESVGRQTRTCQAPGCTEPPEKEKREIGPLGHDWSDWIVVEAARPEIAGLERRVCSRCAKDEKRQTKPLPKLEPKLESKPKTTQILAADMAQLDASILSAGALRQIDLGEGVTLAMIWCPPGGDIARGFWLGKYEVTQTQWTHVMKSNPSKYGRGDPDRMPVDSVSLADCESFASRLNKMLGVHGFRLPSAREWQYACTAGGTDFTVNSEDMNSRKKRKKGPTPVGSFPANGWGFCDMLGNVGECTPDIFRGNSFLGFSRKDGMTVCGGWWNKNVSECLPTSRYRGNLKGDKCFGLRICFSPPDRQGAGMSL